MPQKNQGWEVRSLMPQRYARLPDNTTGLGCGVTHIAICAPSGPFAKSIAPRVTALAKAEFSGVELSFHPQCFAEHNHFAGTDEVRLKALVECANDPGVDAVWFARGGYGSVRIAEAALAKFGPEAKAKIYMGYSDAGYLLGALYQARIGHPVHGPMPVDGKDDTGLPAIRRALSYFSGDFSGLEPSLDKRPVAAFNLMTLAMLCGTPMMPDLTGHVVMVEEVSEHLYAIDRLFFHVTAHLHDIAGLRLGRVSLIPENERPFGETAEEIARLWCQRSGIPFLGSANIGHDPANRIVPFGLAGRG